MIHLPTFIRFVCSIKPARAFLYYCSRFPECWCSVHQPPHVSSCQDHLIYVFKLTLPVRAASARQTRGFEPKLFGKARLMPLIPIISPPTPELGHVLSHATGAEEQRRYANSEIGQEIMCRFGKIWSHDPPPRHPQQRL